MDTTSVPAAPTPVPPQAPQQSLPPPKRHFGIWFWIGGIIVAAAIAGGVYYFLGVNTFSRTPEATAINEAFAEGDLAALIGAAEAATESYPNDADAYIALSLAYGHAGSLAFEEEEYGPKAVDAALKALDLGSRRPEAYRALGFGYEIQQRYIEALAAYDEGLAMAPTYAPLLSQRGHSLDLMGRTEEAGNYYRQALVADPMLEHARVNYARFLFRKGDDASLSEARTLAQGLIDQTTTDISSAAAYSLLGSIEYSRRDYTAAIAAFEESVRLDPAFVPGGVGLGWARFATLESLRGNEAALRARVQSIFTIVDVATTIHPYETSAYHLAGLLNAFLGQTEEARKLLTYARDVALPEDISLGAAEKEVTRASINEDLASL